MNTEIRCAVYTRKSTEDGLEQEFNSLDAQRESAENFIACQKHKGWVCIPEHYDDGGFSGGNTERPALKKLIDDIRDGKIGVVVVYKIDRLSRSLLDFSELLTLFEQYQVSFVSVTQDINTSSSSGRMMLNILMTFAQFEREVIAERIRDKIALSKKRGKYCGGPPIMGYEVEPKTKVLLPHPEEAPQVREIFEKYAAVTSLVEVTAWANRMKYHKRAWISGNGKKHSSVPFTPNSLDRMLRNPIYGGYVRHKTVKYKGEHEAIVPEELWNRVQEILDSRKCGTLRNSAKHLHPLAGLIFCGNCNSHMSPTYTYNHKRKYTYYFCQQNARSGENKCPLKRVPAGDIEEAILRQLSRLFRMPTLMHVTLSSLRQREVEARKQCSARLEELESLWEKGSPVVMSLSKSDAMALRPVEEEMCQLRTKLAAMKEPIDENDILKAMQDISGLWNFLFPGEKHELVRRLIARVDIYESSLSFELRMDGLKALADELVDGEFFTQVHTEADGMNDDDLMDLVLEHDTVKITLPLILKRMNGRKQIIVPSRAGERAVQETMIRAIGLAHRWNEMLLRGEVKSISELAASVGCHHPYASRIMSLNNLDPAIVTAIVEGREPDGLSLAQLFAQGIPEDWMEQRRLFGFTNL